MENSMRIPVKPLLISLILVLFSACAGTSTFTVEEPWSRPGFRGDNGAVYLNIINGGEFDENLIGVSTDIAAAAEMHLSRMDENGVITMEPQDLIVIPAGSSLEFTPGGLHIMLVNLMRDLSVGDSFPITLEIQRGGDITVQVEVRAP
jgi:copper(I)-binding protein